MIKDLEAMANLNIPKDLASDEAKRYLIEACAKYDVKCPPPQTTSLRPGMDPSPSTTICTQSYT
jgi:hypothetical protein